MIKRERRAGVGVGTGGAAQSVHGNYISYPVSCITSEERAKHIGVPRTWSCLGHHVVAGDVKVGAADGHSEAVVLQPLVYTQSCLRRRRKGTPNMHR